MDFIGNIEPARFTYVLYAVYQFTRYTFSAQIFGYGNVEGHGKTAFICNEPTWNVFRDDFYVADFYDSLLSVDVEGKFLFFFELQNVVLRHARNFCG